MSAGVLVVLRGNSGSGKTSVAREVQRRLPRGTCAVVSQDDVRRLVLREPDEEGRFNVELIGIMAAACLARDMSVLVEGILDSHRYQWMLEQLASQAAAARFFAWDLSFEETVRRHAMRPQREESTPDDMRPGTTGGNRWASSRRSASTRRRTWRTPSRRCSTQQRPATGRRGPWRPPPVLTGWVAHRPGADGPPGGAAHA